MGALPGSEGDPAVRLRVRVPYAGHPPSINEAIRKRAVQTSEITAAWKANTILAARDAALQLHLRLPLPTSVIRMTVPMPDWRRRDAGNYSSTVLKAAIDGLVVARLFEDDTPQHVVLVDPKLEYLAGLKDPRVQARAFAIIDIVPLATLRAALSHAPELDGLFDPPTPRS